MMMDGIFEEEKNNKPKRKIKRDLSKSEAFGTEIRSNRKDSEADAPGYLDDFLQHSRGAVFITGNKNIQKNNPILKKKKIIKRVLKKKKISDDASKLEELEKTKEEKDEIKRKGNEEINAKKKEKDIYKKELIKQEIVKKIDNFDSPINNNQNHIKKIANNNNVKSLDNSLIFKKLNNLIKKNIFNEIKNVLKALLIFQKIKEFQKKYATKISSIFRGYLARQKWKMIYLTLKIIKSRKEKALKINSFCKIFLLRNKVKKLRLNAKKNYILYSSLKNNKVLYFKYKNQNGSENNIFFEYSPILKCFITFINKNEKNRKIIEGNFYNEKNSKLIDPLYEINNKGENIINFPKLFKIEDNANQKNDRIKNRYINLHRPVKRETVDDYEERKRKVLDDDQLTKSHIIKCRKTTVGAEIPRSKSFIKLKPKKGKGILKPSRSYINLKCEEKKIHFGNARIKKYHAKK